MINDMLPERISIDDISDDAAMGYDAAPLRYDIERAALAEHYEDAPYNIEDACFYAARSKATDESYEY
jgi:hypothetical protein